MESVRNTIDKVCLLKPDRIAFYSYAHVPWIKKGQRRFTELDLPLGENKRALYELGRELFEAKDYVEIGMDHFALKSDPLYKATQPGSGYKLHRNFMGYTTTDSMLMIGLGVSAISDSWTAFAQNTKVVEEYTEQVNKGMLPVFKGHVLSDEDRILRQHILRIMCRFETNWEKKTEQHPSLYEALDRMQEMTADGLLSFRPFGLKVTERGKAFVRNICMAFDARLWRNQPRTQIFSATV
jgi:oxygen-independent coproporphyrinogen-3 oxidase